MPTDDPDIMTPAELGQKLVVALRSVSDPQALMQAIADRTAVNLRAELTTRLDAMEQATSLWHDDLVRVPTDVDRAIAGLRDQLRAESATSVAKVEGSIASHVAETKEKFNGINNQFSQNDKALTAALQAQEKQAIATNDSNTAASTKMEAGFAAALKQGQEFLMEVRKNFETQIGDLRKNSETQIQDLKSRLDKGEGRTSVSDPAMTAAISALTSEVKLLRDSSVNNQGRATATTEVRKDSRDNWVLIVGVGSMLAAFGLLFLKSTGIH